MTELFTVLGGLGVFLFGLRIMSGGLQKLAGTRLRSVLGGLTRNRFTGVFSGFLITCAVQSSSATTVLVVSFANAGLLTLTQTLGLVMGANIGTTVTAWIVSLLGFKLKIAAFALPIIGLGFPLSLLKSPRTKHLSEVMIGFGLLFLGLSFLKDAVPDFKSNPAAFEFAQSLTGFGFGSTLLFVLLGTVLTVAVQSSSASTAITLTMVAKGWIDLDLAAAMILGENIGTTITAQLASIGANRDARRVATFHTLFNVIGVCWMLLAMPLVLGLIPHDHHWRRRNQHAGRDHSGCVVPHAIQRHQHRRLDRLRWQTRSAGTSLCPHSKRRAREHTSGVPRNRPARHLSLIHI